MVNLHNKIIENKQTSKQKQVTGSGVAYTHTHRHTHTHTHTHRHTQLCKTQLHFKISSVLNLQLPQCLHLSNNLSWPLILLLIFMTLVLVRVSIPAQTSWPRSKFGRKAFIQLKLPCCCSSLKEVRTGTQADQEAGVDAEVMEGCFLMDCFPWLAQSALLYKLRIAVQGWSQSTRDLPS